MRAASCAARLVSTSPPSSGAGPRLGALVVVFGLPLLPLAVGFLAVLAAAAFAVVVAGLLGAAFAVVFGGALAFAVVDSGFFALAMVYSCSVYFVYWARNCIDANGGGK
jgi:hypothetical protein